MPDEEGRRSPMGYTYGCFDRRPVDPDRDPLMVLAVAAGILPPPAGRQAALPGTEEKVRVLEQRAQLGQALWHMLDAKLEAVAPLLEVA